MNLMEGESDDRSIHWLWDAKGKIGKTTIAKHLCLKDDEIIYVNGKAADIKSCIAKRLEAGKDLRGVIFGIPRTAQDYVSYAALEEIKDGICFSGKYESEMLMFNPPHIVVLANFPPDQSKLSMDRWEIKDLGDKTTPLFNFPEENANHGKPNGIEGPTDFKGFLEGLDESQ
jgi:hypothetical protein